MSKQLYRLASCKPGHSFIPYLLAALLFIPAVHAEDCVPVGKVLLPASNEWINTSKLIQASAGNKIILLGEHHDNMEHHRWQLQMIIALHTLNPKLALGFEMFPRKSQAVLDKWVRGELSEAEFLKQTDWDGYWSFDPQLYMPMFHYARMNGIPMYALNVDRDLIRQVGQQGWANIDAEQREGISDSAPASEGYRQMLAGVFMQHGSQHDKKPSEEDMAKTLAMPAFNRFVESQLVWDRAMAEAIATAVKSNADAQVVAVLGSGHMMYHFGVPEQLQAMSLPKPKALVPWDPEFECEYIQANFADAVIGLKTIRHSEQDDKQDKPKLGVYLDTTEQGVIISKVMPDSIAEQMTLKDHDMIIKMAGRDIAEIAEVIEIVKATQFGTWLPITIKREDELIEFIAKFPAASKHNKD